MNATKSASAPATASDAASGAPALSRRSLVRQILRGAQAKLSVGQPDDAFEHEADQVADSIMQEDESTDTAPLLADLELSDEPVIVHRASAAGKTSEEKRSDAPEGERSASVAEDATPVVGELLRVSAGQPLDASTRSFMESRFHVDFSRVRVHDGAEAAASAHVLNAHAFTVGRHIVFNEGRYQPASNQGKRLLAHELTHVVQQSGTRNGVPWQEMVPGFHASHQARPMQALARPAVQRDKIDHRQLTWDDFQGKAPKKSKFWASTASGFNPPDLKALIPKKLEAQDTGEECVVAKKKSGDVMGTTFRVDIGLDSNQVAVTPYMWQEKSWRMPWTTDEEARKKKCKAEVVKKCNQSFVKQLKQIDKECKKQQKACKKAFKAGDIASWSIEIGDEEISAANAQECTDVILARCRELMAGDLSFSYSMAGVTITAHSKEECGKEFQQACVGELLDAAANRLLEHEQGHFDITNARAEQAQDALRALVDGFDREVSICVKGDTAKAQKAGKAKTVAKAKAVLAKELKTLKKEYAKQHKGLAATQKQYDNETQHGVVEAMQQAWQEQISEGLP